MVDPKVKARLDDHRDQHMEKLFELLRFAAIANNDDDQCPKCAAWLAEYLEQIGLSASIMPTDGGKDVVFAEGPADPDRPTLLIYGHYDVQPPDPLDEWLSDPFEPVVRDGNVYARGASDDKGQLFSHLMAIDAWLHAAGRTPVNIKVLVEGEEEIGSPSLEPFVRASAHLLSADAAVISDSAFFAPDVPSILTGLRGLAYVEISVKGPRADVHSGINGGLVANPINALARIVAAMHDDTGRVTLPGFYDAVLTPSDRELAEWDKLPFDRAGYAESMGAPSLGGGERDLPPLTRRWARPTLDANGIVGGYTGPGAKTIIPAEASVKISMRLVPDQDPEKIAAAMQQFIAANTPEGVTAEMSLHSTGRPVLLDAAGSAIQAARAAMSEAFGREATFIRCGASIPVTELFQRLLGLDAAMMGFGLPDDGPHSPNEKFALAHLHGGAVASAAFMAELADRACELK